MAKTADIARKRRERVEASRKRREKLDQQARYEDTFSELLFEDAEAIVTSESGNGHKLEPSHAEMSAWLREHMRGVRKLSDREHVTRLRLAYAAFVYKSKHPGFDKWLEALRGEVGVKETKATDRLSYVVRSVISYGSSDAKEDGEPRRSQQLVSRDVRALRCLMNEGVAPSAMEALAEEAGEGLDRWADRRAAQLSQSKAPSASKKTATVAALPKTLSVAFVCEQGVVRNAYFDTPAEIKIIELAFRKAMKRSTAADTATGGTPPDVATRLRSRVSTKATPEKRERKEIKLNVKPITR